ncbi:MAG: hypothetical protein KKH93_06410 [Candidatus Omnitrophica bacterium]|nr:hypothetical protein [Candidatus Omnitrophota bacterium]MBU2044943.1 hypothetical protein [Candidatus Omnitrophota bacterium]MBU2250845.1 hypothetical protein [Candidatus Omnitrophota bacterium]MBU2265908.1 hypothetical protein [Candidatus Omnitrophota bacterium]MBU2473533.1 hypothetical protein [Candidatus Omnitrophota bacterium]
MKKDKFQSIKAQTALEYIAASFVFATVGIGTFLAINQASVLSTVGNVSSYGTDQTLQGAALEGAGDLPETELPADWGVAQEGLGGASPIDTIAAAENATSTWDNNQEASLAGQEGQYWDENQGTELGVNLLEGESYAPDGIQTEFNSLTGEYLGLNQAGYTEDDVSYVNQGVSYSTEGISDDWFIGLQDQD